MRGGRQPVPDDRGSARAQARERATKERERDTFRSEVRSIYGTPKTFFTPNIGVRASEPRATRPHSASSSTSRLYTIEENPLGADPREPDRARGGQLAEGRRPRRRRDGSQRNRGRFRLNTAHIKTGAKTLRNAIRPDAEEDEGLVISIADRDNTTVSDGKLILMRKRKRTRNDGAGTDW